MDPRKIASLLIATMAVAGCSFNRSTDRPRESLLARIGGGGEVIAPKRCLLTVVMLSRPQRDDVVNRDVWRTADEQAVPPEVRRVWQANGLRIGLVTGELPAEVDAVLKAPPPHKVEPAQYVISDGENSLIALCPQVPETNLLLNLKGQPFGKDFRDASGFLRMTASYDGATGIGLRLVPEIHHGPIQRSIGAVPNTVGFTPQEFTFKDGQQEETLRDLAASLVLQPNQVAVIGGLAERPSSLGSFLFTQPEPNSDRLNQKVVLIWARQGATDKPGGGGLGPALIPVEPPKP